MAAQSVSGIIRSVFMCTVSGAPRREFWSRFGKEIELVVFETVEEVKKEPISVCPPLQRRAYTPPEDLQSHLKSYVEVFGSSLPSSWQDIFLEDGHLKFNLLVHLMRGVRDVLDFYNVPIQDRSKFNGLSASNLPPSLKITWSY
uniref:Large ribosomal subunit protein mL50 n=1 Tax=Aotus nancymaae TaxID=37293 RepID=A0A2K5EAN9_AOTNA